MKVEDILVRRNWRVVDQSTSRIVDWCIEVSATFRDGDTVAYSALAVLSTGEVRPLLMIRELATYELWGDTCQLVNGAWCELDQSEDWIVEAFVADPASNDPSFMGEYSPEKQRAGFERWRDRLQAVYTSGS